MRPAALLFASALFLSSFPGAQAADAPPAAKPNIVWIVADDLGYADCGVHGCRDVPTPHLDALAAAGVRFTDGYVTGAVCSPTRAALLTGRHQLRDGVPDWIPPGKPGLNAGVPTLANYLKKAGYRTAAVGKWHLGEQDECHPLRRGFDEFFGFLGGGRNYFPDPARAAGAKVNHYTQIVRGREPVAESEYTTHAFGREAVDFLARQQGKAQPFFLYLAFNAVHTPMQAPDDYLQRFTAIEDPKRRTYAGMLAAMDDAVGRVLKAIRDAGFEERTLVCFISDNGGPITRNAPNASRNTPLRGGKGETWEGGIRVPFFMKWPSRLKPGATFREPVIQMDLAATVLALAGQRPDANWPMDGVNLMPVLTGEAKLAPRAFCWEYHRQWAIREGQWKLTFALPTKDATTPVLGLYDLSQDIGESRDLSAAEPERVKQMQAAWTRWRNSLGGNLPAAPEKPKTAGK
jgi:arylsulfatase A-like enzyme